MKKLILAIVLTCVFSSLAIANVTEEIYVSVTITPGLSISLSQTTWAIGPISPATTEIMTGGEVIQVTNNGTGADEMFSLHLAEATPWTPVSGNPGAEEFSLRALYTTTAAGSLTAADFVASEDDIMTTAAEDPTTTIFAKNDEGVTAKGYNVTVSDNRDLVLAFFAPITTSETNAQYITVTVTAELS